MVRYEDLKGDTEGTLRRISEFLAHCSFRPLRSDSTTLHRAMELSLAERMRALEAKEAGNWVLTKGTRADKPFIRAAIAGGWKSGLPADSIAAIEAAWGDLMHRLEYERSDQQVADGPSRGAATS